MAFLAGRYDRLELRLKYMKKLDAAINKPRPVTLKITTINGLDL